MRIIVTIVACVLVLAAGAGIYLLLDFLSPEPAKVDTQQRLPLVRVQVARAQEHRIDVPSQGTVTPRREIQLVAQVAGTATAVSPALVNGGFFQKDEVLVQLDRRDYEYEITRVAAQVAQAKLRVSRELAEAEIARKEWKALGKGEASPLTVREPQVLDAKSALKAAEASLKKSELALERTTIKAPFAGRVRQESVDVGQFLGVGTPIAQIYSIDFAEVRLPLHDDKLRYLDVPLGNLPNKSQALPKVTLRARFAGAERKWTAEIVRTEGEIDPKSRMVQAIAQISDPYGRNASGERPPLAVGLFVHALIHGKSFPNVFEIPRDALREGQRVLIVDADDRLRYRPVETLFADARSVFVSRGLKDGDRVCLSPLAIVFDGMRIKVAENGKAEGSQK